MVFTKSDVTDIVEAVFNAPMTTIQWDFIGFVVNGALGNHYIFLLEKCREEMDGMAVLLAGTIEGLAVDGKSIAFPAQGL